MWTQAVPAVTSVPEMENAVNRSRFLGVVVGIFTVGAIVLAQRGQPLSPSATSGLPIAASQAAVPPFLPVSGVLLDVSGKPIAGSVEITLAIYSESKGGTPLWSEAQTVTADSRGQYNVTIGAATPIGIPVSVFAGGGIRWLGITPIGEHELARSPILSVPYALKAADADTLGGVPASAFVRADSANGVTDAPSSNGSNSLANTGAPTTIATAAAMTTGNIKGNGTANFVSKFLDASTIGNSVIFESVSGNVGLEYHRPYCKARSPGCKHHEWYRRESNWIGSWGVVSNSWGSRSSGIEHDRHRRVWRIQRHQRKYHSRCLRSGQ